MRLTTLGLRIAAVGPIRQTAVAAHKRSSARERGYTWQWQKARNAWLAEHPLCRVCEQAGRVAAATEVDHIIPHRGDMDLFWDADNWQSICTDCHIAKTKAEQGGSSTWSDDLAHPPGLMPSAVPLTIVCGPPASGKTKWVGQQAFAGDLVVDLDVIKSEVSGLPLHKADSRYLRPALERRNELLHQLGDVPPRWPRAWFIVGEPKPEWRAWWQKALRPERIVVLETPDEVCLARIADTPDRRSARAGQSEAVMRWWNLYRPRPGEERLAP